MFDLLKAKVVNTIEKSSDVEITNETDFEDSGIYMIYINRLK